MTWSGIIRTVDGHVFDVVKTFPDPSVNIASGIGKFIKFDGPRDCYIRIEHIVSFEFHED